MVMMSVALVVVAWAQDPISPHSAIEPPAAKAAASLAASTQASPPELLTTGEKSDWNETAPYAEAVEISHRLERASRFVKVLEIGTTPEGRTMIALVVSKDRAFTPEAAAQDRQGRHADSERHSRRRNRRQGHRRSCWSATWWSARNTPPGWTT